MTKKVDGQKQKILYLFFLPIFICSGRDKTNFDALFKALCGPIFLFFVSNAIMHCRNQQWKSKEHLVNKKNLSFVTSRTGVLSLLDTQFFFEKP